MRVFGCSRNDGTSPLPHPTAHRILALGGRVGERADTAIKL